MEIKRHVSPMKALVSDIESVLITVIPKSSINTQDRKSYI